MKCSIDGCDHKHYAHGYCEMHYARIRKRGSVGGVGPERRENGSGTITPFGYCQIGVDYDRKYEHVLVAEKALGHALPVGADVHHVDCDRSNNEPTNLVICPSREYHLMLHRRMRALEACGYVDWLKCSFCKVYDDPVNMRVYRDGKSGVHRDCEATYKRERYRGK